MYFVIHQCDGATFVSILDKAEFEERLKENYWGSDIKFLDKFSEENTDYWRGAVLVIKGEISPPQPKEVVTRWEVV